MVEAIKPDLIRDLENKYCPPLDPALFAAIVNDYDLSDETSNQELCDTLDTLKASAAEQEDAPFDPSGTSGCDTFGDVDNGGVASEQSVSQRTLRSLDTNITSLGSNLSHWSEEQDGSSEEQKETKGSRTQLSPIKNAVPTVNSYTGLDVDGKQSYLREMFPSVDQYTIRHTLKKCHDDIDQSMDVLLNLAFFEGQGLDGEGISVPKGIDGFGESNRVQPRKKGKEKHKKGRPLLQQSSSSPAVTDIPGQNVENRWENGKKDIDFICSRTPLSNQTVSSAYHLNGASLSATIRFLGRGETQKHPNDTSLDNPVTNSQVAELQQEFSTVSSTELVGLLLLTRNSISAANELATVMISEPAPPTILPEISLAKPTSHIIENDVDNTMRKRTRPSSTPSWDKRDYNTTRRIADNHIYAGQVAFEKANAAYRRGKSDRLMGGVAGYYSTIGRDHMDKAKREAAAAADALAEAQSTNTVLDLHGVNVQDGVRIATSRVEYWWESLGDSKYRNGGGSSQVREGFRIITGLGRHSKNGTARLGPAVARTLAKEGWRVEVGEGVLIVTGMVRHR